MRKQVLAWPRPGKRAVVVAVDVVLAMVATWVAYSLRLETLHWPSITSEWWPYLLTPALAIPIFVRFGLYLSLIHISEPTRPY